MLFGYFFVVSFILLTVPFVEEMMYKGSFELIRGLKVYHTPELTKFINIISHIGEGEAYFYFCMIFFMSGHEYVFTYLTGTYFMTQHWINWLKSVYRSPRP